MVFDRPVLPEEGDVQVGDALARPAAILELSPLHLGLLLFSTFNTLGAYGAFAEAARQIGAQDSRAPITVLRKPAGLDELRAAIREEMETAALQQAEAEYLDKVLDAMIEGAVKIEYPPQARLRPSRFTASTGLSGSTDSRPLQSSEPAPPSRKSARPRAWASWTA